MEIIGIELTDVEPAGTSPLTVENEVPHALAFVD